LNDGEPIAPFVVHDLRRTATTNLARLGIALPTVEKLLNHVSGSFGGVAGIYNRHDFLDEKKAALEVWAQHLLGIVR
jgi:integrase